MADDTKSGAEEFEILEVGADGKPLARAEGADSQAAGAGAASKTRASAAAKKP